MILQDCVKQLMQRQPLNPIDCQNALQEMLSENANPLQIAAFLTLLRSKTETSEELIAFAEAIKKSMTPMQTSHRVLDIVGTGGDHAETVNISTGSAILTASCGVKVAKHGNRAVSSLAGSADVLEALGIKIELSPQQIATCIDTIGIGFCFSPQFYPAFQRLRHIRKQLNIPTIFNLLGPLLNPADPEHIILGTFDQSMLPLFAETVQKMKNKHSAIVHGCGLDEISSVGPSTLLEITSEKIEKRTISPEDFGLERCNLQDLKGGDAKMNAQMIKLALSGKHIAIANTLMMNTAVALYLYGMYSSIAEGFQHAYENLFSGSALVLLNQWVEFSQDSDYAPTQFMR